MPTFASSDLPPPTSWEEFETIVVDIVREEWHDPGSSKYGRSGQAQEGVDVYCKPPHLDEEYCGFQCKRTDKLDIESIEAEVEKAEGFQPPLSEYVVMTTASEDKHLQQEVRELSADRVEKGQFPIQIQMWDKISQTLSNHSTLLETHYPQFVDRSEQLASQGFVRLSPKYFYKISCEEPTVCWRTGFNICEVRKYTPDRYYLTDEGNRDSVIENLCSLLQNGKSQTVVGPPGSGKSTICRGVACHWYEKQLGTVFYRKANQIELLNAPLLVAERIRGAAGHVLVVVENAAGEHIEGTHQLINQFRNAPDVTFLLEARQPDWNNRNESLTSPRLKQLGETYIAAYRVPAIDFIECKRIIKTFKDTTGAKNVPSSETLYRDLLDFEEGHSLKNDQIEDKTSQFGAGIYYLSHRLSLHASNLEGVELYDKEQITKLESEVQNIYAHICSWEDNTLPLDIAFAINILNICGVGVYREILHSIAKSDGQHASIEQTLRNLDGKMVFLAEDANNIRTNHKYWSFLYLRRVVQQVSEYEARKQLERCLNTITDTLTNDDALRELKQFSSDSGSIFRSITSVRFLCNIFLPRIFELGPQYPALGPLLGTSKSIHLNIPNECAHDLEIVLAICRGRTNHIAGNYSVAIDELTIALQLAEQNADKKTPKFWKSQIYSNLANVESVRGNIREAKKWTTKCLNEGETESKMVLPIDIFVQMGIVCQSRQNVGLAHYYFTTGLDIAQATDNQCQESICCIHLGNLAQDDLDLPAAEKWYKQSRDIAEQINDKKLLSYSLNNLGNTFLKKAESARRKNWRLRWQENIDHAQSCYETSLKMTRERGDQVGVVKALHGCGKIAHERGNLVEARETFERGLDLAQQLSFRYSEAIARMSLGDLSLSQGNVEKLIDEYEEAICIFGELGEISKKADATRSLIDIKIDCNDYAGACRLLMDITSDYLSIGHMFAAAGSLDELISLLPIALSPEEVG